MAARTAVYAALAANVAVALAKAAAGVLSGSNAMLAEAAHSVSDSVNQLFLRVSLSRAEREPDPEHPFGHGHERFFWAFLAAIVIFLSGAVFSCARGALALAGHGGEGKHFVLNYGILGFALVAEGLSLAQALRQVRRGARETGLPFARFARESRDPTTKTVLYEDSAALVGIALAFAGIALHQVTGNASYDAAASIAIGLVLLGVAFTVGHDAWRLLLGAAARPEEIEAVRETIESHPAVRDLVDLRTLALHPDSLLVAARVDFVADTDATTLQNAAREIDEAVRANVRDVSEVYLDPSSRAGEAAEDP